MKRLISWILVLAIFASTLPPISVHAMENDEETYSESEASAVELTADAAEEPTAESTDAPVEEATKEVAVEESTEESTTEATEASAEEPTETPATEAPIATIKEPATEPIVEPTVAAIEETTTESIAVLPVAPEEEPAIQSTEAPVEESATEPVNAEMPIGDSAENTASAPVQKFNGYQTLDDFGISTTSAYSLRRDVTSSSYLNPQTIRPTSSYYGYQFICNRTGFSYPFTATFNLDSNYMPQNSVYIAIANYDCDELGDIYSCEYDMVYINGNCVGVLTGNNATSNTTLLKVDRSFLKAGENQITIRVGIKIKDAGSSKWGDPTGTIYADDPYNVWWLRVDDVQLLCDGGSAEGRPDAFRVNLTNAEISGNDVNCYVNTYVEDSQNRTFSLEYALYDWSSEASPTYGQIIDDDFATISKGNYNDIGSLTLPLNSLSGTYTAVVYLKGTENGTQTILAYDEESFEYETGIVPAFDIQNLTATPATMEWTAGPVTVNLSADIDVTAGLKDLVFYMYQPYFASEDEAIQVDASVDANGHVTGSLDVTENGFYTVGIRYTKEGKSHKKTTSLDINNILNNLDAPVLNTTGKEEILKDRTFTVDWNEVENATAYNIVLWDITGLPEDTENGIELTRIENEEALTFSHIFDKVGTYRIDVYAACPGSTKYSQSKTPGSVIVNVTVPSKLDNISLNVEQDDLVTEENFIFTWNEIEYADHYLFSLWDITKDEEGTPIHVNERIESDARNSFNANLTAGRRYRAWISAVPEEVDQISQEGSSYTAEFDYRILPGFTATFVGSGKAGDSGTVSWTVPTSGNGVEVIPDNYVIEVYYEGKNGQERVYTAKLSGNATKMNIVGSAFSNSGIYTIFVYACMDDSWGDSIRSVVEVKPSYTVGIPRILEAGRYVNGQYTTGTSADYNSAYTFWATTTLDVDEVYVYVDDTIRNNGQPLTPEKSKILDNDTCRYEVNFSLKEGEHTIIFRTKDGSSEAITTFYSISKMSPTPMYAAKNQVRIKTWPSSTSPVVDTVLMTTEFQVEGEIDINNNEGYYYIHHNGKAAFVRKGDLTEITF